MIYSKLGIDNKMHLFITAEGTDVPAPDDIQLTYKNNAGEEVEVDEYKFFYDELDNVQQVKASKQTFVTANDIKVNVYAGDELIIGAVDYVDVSFSGTLVANTTLEVNDTTITSEVTSVEVAQGADAVVTVTPDSGYSFSGTPKIVIGGSSKNFTVSGGVATYTIEEVSEDISFDIDVTVIE